MWYLIVAEDVEKSLEKRMESRPRHLERLQKLHDEGRLLTAGPNPIIDSDSANHTGFSGSVIIAEFDSLQEAQHWANLDPYIMNNVYKNVTVKPYKKVF